MRCNWMRRSLIWSWCSSNEFSQFHEVAMFLYMRISQPFARGETRKGTIMLHTQRQSVSAWPHWLGGSRDSDANCHNRPLRIWAIDMTAVWCSMSWPSVWASLSPLSGDGAIDAESKNTNGPDKASRAPHQTVDSWWSYLMSQLASARGKLDCGGWRNRSHVSACKVHLIDETLLCLEIESQKSTSHVMKGSQLWHDWVTLVNVHYFKRYRYSFQAV